MSQYEELIFSAEKHNDDARWSFGFFRTLDQAKSWVGSSINYRITDKNTNEVVAQANPEALDSPNYSIQELVDTADQMTERKRDFY